MFTRPLRRQHIPNEVMLSESDEEADVKCPVNMKRRKRILKKLTEKGSVKGE